MTAARKVCLLLITLWIAIAPAVSHAGVFLSITVAPPPLPVYVQPVCPAPNYLWTPGYWAWGTAGYYWVPGVWVAAPRPGLLWTPGYWAFSGGYYGWHAGFWGPHIGFYGGVNYGFGYTGVGFVGGRWAGGVFSYNTAVMHVNTAIVHNVYVDRTVIRSTVVNRASFNGPGGINARPTGQEMAANREQHFGPTAFQSSHERTASFNRGNLASVNGGHPQRAAIDRSVNFNQRRGYNAPRGNQQRQRNPGPRRYNDQGGRYGGNQERR